MAVVKNDHGIVKNQKNGLKMVNLLLFKLVLSKVCGFQKCLFVVRLDHKFTKSLDF